MDTPQMLSPETASMSSPVQGPSHKIIQWVTTGLFLLVIGFLAAVVLPTLLGDRTMVIISGSMEPTIPIGAAAIMKPVPSGNLQMGDVIAYTPRVAGAIPIVHRIVSITERNGVRYYQTRGDANQTADANEFTLPATAWRLWYHIPAAGYLVAFASSRLGTFLLIVVPLALLILTKAVDWRKNHRTRQPSHEP